MWIDEDLTFFQVSSLPFLSAIFFLILSCSRIEIPRSSERSSYLTDFLHYFFVLFRMTCIGKPLNILVSVPAQALDVERHANKENSRTSQWRNNLCLMAHLRIILDKIKEKLKWIGARERPDGRFRFYNRFLKLESTYVFSHYYVVTGT